MLKILLENIVQVFHDKYFFGCFFYQFDELRPMIYRSIGRILPFSIGKNLCVRFYVLIVRGT